MKRKTNLLLYDRDGIVCIYIQYRLQKKLYDMILPISIPSNPYS